MAGAARAPELPQTTPDRATADTAGGGEDSMSNREKGRMTAGRGGGWGAGQGAGFPDKEANLVGLERGQRLPFLEGAQ